ncbi:undecaprenyl-diphosphate phosphatase [Mechercharimyces sp. CAU 1602]|uniref:undecaprenyl-diphosphate phosphatase n=1 Tax=Mechercharimyces sp. CAU 1602 TaxID=2973933 RepID=UPI0021619333|nr:undecaprenyl-diphosphate phosphatase [Mechercharimyces sp. CAU 1602]MCS1351831.1 undecaprenyl-diphosphate phosphatase [Mechercharimyces sp. CAU 1602]
MGNLETWIEAIILGLVQGLTEFLPISSSGHLVIAEKILGVDEPDLAFELLLHFGSLLAVFIFFWKDIVQIIIGLVRYPLTRKQVDRTPFMMGIYLLISTVVTGVMVVLFQDILEQHAKSLPVIACSLFVTGLFLWWLDGKSGLKRTGDLKISDALWIGLAQGVALIPGISRSGATVVAGLMRGLDKKTALNYSFLLAIPVIGGGALLQLLDYLDEGGSSYFAAGPYVTAVLVSFLSAVVGIKWFMNLMDNTRLRPFAIYCWCVSVAIVIALMV